MRAEARIAVATWIVLLTVGVVIVWRRGECLDAHRDYVATHLIPQNHRLRRSDFREPDAGVPSLPLYLPDPARLVGRYIARPVASGDPIRPADLLPHPVVAANDASVLAFVSLPAAFAEALDVGSFIDVKAKETIVAPHRRAEAIWCNGANCSAIVRLDDSQSKALGGSPPTALIHSAWSDPMLETQWKEVMKLDLPVASPGIWTLVLPLVPSNATLRFESRGNWTYSDQPPAACGPDGDPASAVPLSTVLTDAAPVGAIVGKIGGSTAGRKDGTIFVVGSSAVFNTAQSNGPLYLAVNIDPVRAPKNQTTIQVTVSEVVP